MNAGILDGPPAPSAPGRSTGGVPARRAMIRWAWRLFRREWRQQILILLLVTVAVAAVVVGSAVATNTPSPANAGFGSAQDLAVFNLSAPTSKSATQGLSTVEARIAALSRRYGAVQVIENETHTVPGSTQTYQLRSQDPHGPYAGPMLQLLSGHYPAGTNQVALTPGLASELDLHVGDTWAQGGKRVVGIVQNPQSLLDEFALVPPGQVSHPTTVEALFDAAGVDPGRIGSNVSTPAQSANTNTINPGTIVLALATVGMLLIALVSIGGFTVLAQRRMRSLGMLESLGATDRNVRIVLEANGAMVGMVGALAGFALGLVAWLAYRPHNEQSAHHLIAMFALPWNVIVPAMVLALVRDLRCRWLPRARHHTHPGRHRPGRAPRATAPGPPIVRPRCDRTRHRVRVLLPLGSRARGQRCEVAGPRVRCSGCRNHPRVPVLPGAVGASWTKVTGGHPPSVA